MAPQWVGYVRPLILLITAINVIVTIAFDAQVEEQGGAYATGVLALFLSAAIAVTLALRAEARAQREGGWKALPYAIITLIFGYTFTANIVERPDGLYISFAFILSVMVLGAWSRWNRATELRVEKITWATPESEALFESIRGRRVHIVTIKDEEGVLKQKRSEIGRDPRFAIITSHKERVVRHYNVDGAFCFVHLDLAQDRSAFDTSLHVRISRIGDDYLLIGSNAVAVANAIAYLSERIDPISIFLGLTQENPMRQAMKYMLWGEGETGILVYQILQRYWDWTPEHDLRPNIYLMSESNAGLRSPSAPDAGTPTPSAGA
jgi:hypothetical protein